MLITRASHGRVRTLPGSTTKRIHLDPCIYSLPLRPFPPPSGHRRRQRGGMRARRPTLRQWSPAAGPGSPSTSRTHASAHSGQDVNAARLSLPPRRVQLSLLQTQNAPASPVQLISVSRCAGSTSQVHLPLANTSPDHTAHPRCPPWRLLLLLTPVPAAVVVFCPTLLRGWSSGLQIDGRVRRQVTPGKRRAKLAGPWRRRRRQGGGGSSRGCWPSCGAATSAIRWHL